MADVRDAAQPARRRPAIRFAAFLALWCVLIGVAPLDLAVGIPAALLGTMASGRLMPGRGHLDARATLSFALRFLRQSVAAGIDVARRAFDPALPLATGLVTFRPSLPRGFPRDLFATISAMMPGTLPVGGDGRDGLVIHCLDTHQPVAVEMARDEARIRRVLGGGAGHG